MAGLVFLLIVALIIIAVVGGVAWHVAIAPRIAAHKAAVEEAKLFPKFKENVRADSPPAFLRERLVDIYENSDDESTRAAARLIMENHLAPAVSLMKKTGLKLAFDEQLTLIEANIENLETGVRISNAVQVNTFTAYLTSVNEGVVHLPSELDLSNLNLNVLKQAYQPLAISAKPALTKQEQEQLDFYNENIHIARNKVKENLRDEYYALKRAAEAELNKYEALAAPLRKKAGK